MPDSARPTNTPAARRSRDGRARESRGPGVARWLALAIALATLVSNTSAQPPDARRLATNPLPAGPADGFAPGAPDGPANAAASDAVPAFDPTRHATPRSPGERPSVPVAEPANDSGGFGSWLAPEAFPRSLQWMVMLSALSLAPAALLMTTAFVRIMVVLSLLRQALGSPQLPPNQVLTALAVFVTVFVMAPTWEEVYRVAAVPYSKKEISLEEAWNRGVVPIRRFMSVQIERTGNQEDVWLFVRRLPGAREPQTYDEVPLAALVPAFMLSELKTAFLIGFQIYLPFIVLDLVAASVTTAMGMVMLPPGLVSLPLKLLVFVLADGWRLVVGMLLDGFASSG